MKELIRRIVRLTCLCLCVCGTAIAFSQAPTPTFTATPASGCSPLVVSFTDKSSGNPTSWFWDFGNGATSTLQNPSTTYFIPGTYNITLTVTNADGTSTQTFSNYITVFGNPEVDFAGSDSIGCYPFPVQFTDLSKASEGTTNTAWVWDLGDGTQTDVQNPQTKYLHSGLYTVSLKATNDKGCWSTATKKSYIKIDGGIKAAFNYEKAATCHVPFSVQFNNASTGPGQLSYNWLFGDGQSSVETSPGHEFSTAGLFSVALVAISSNGCRDTLRKEELLNLQNITTGFTVPDSLCIGGTTTFVNTSSANAVNTVWDFGDGTTSRATSPVKSFTVPGVYTVRLQQSYGICTDSASKTIKVFPRPSAGFTADKTSACTPPLTVNFQNASEGAVAYHWDFGDGTTSTEASPSHTYTNYGDYVVKLVAVNAFGCADSMTLSDQIKIRQPAIAFDSLPAKGCAPLTHTFHASINSPDNVVSYHWEFSNGIASDLAAPTVTFTEQGKYSVKLTVTTASGCTDTLTLPDAVAVGEKPKVNFSAVPAEVCALQEVLFSNGTDHGTSWHWEFGDGATSGQYSPQHQYGDTGTFSVKLVADYLGCKDSLFIPDYIKVKAPIAKFTLKTTCQNKLNYAFKDQSIGATSWQWNFGDGGTSTEQNPTHTFPAYGTYTVQLTVQNDTCYHLYSQVVSIGNGTPNFTVEPSVVCQGQSTVFTADTTNATNIVSYTWNFGNGSPKGHGISTSTVYPKAGIYDVSLTITDINGCKDSLVKPRLVQINGPTAGLKAINNNGCKGLMATFTNDSKDDGRNKIVTWEWHLGDGTVINNSSPDSITHVYAKAGSFDVGLMVSDASGCTDTLLIPSLVRTSDIKGDFVSADTLSCPGAAVHFTNLSQSLTPAYTSVWSFGNDSSSTQKNPTTSFINDGLYSVKLTIKDAFGCTDSLERPTYISIRRPEASFTVSDSASSCIPLQVHYTNTSTYYTGHVWSLNGGTSLLPNPTQYYNQPGVYQTKLVVTSPGGCTDTAVQNITVYDPTAAFVKYLPLDGCKPLTVDLKTYSPNKMSFVWDFGDGTIISNDDTIARHVYNSFGDFVPKVIMKDAEGCVVPVTGLDTIHILGASAKFGLNGRLLCDSGTVSFSDSTTFNNAITSYNWNFGDGTTSSDHSPSHQFKEPGIYNVSLSLLTAAHCVDTFRLQYPVKVVPSPAVRIIGDSIICEGQGITHAGLFERSDTAEVAWAWQFPNGNTAFVRLPERQIYNEAGKFIVQTVVTNSSSCSDTAYQNIYVKPIPTVTLPSTITTMIGTPVLIPAEYSDSIRTIQWSGAEGLSCTTCPQPYATPKMNTKYRVQVTGDNGCPANGSVQVVVFCNNDNVFVPNTFSPNGDGSNDVFYVRGKGLSRVKTLRIFNRWGQVVFERVNFSVNDATMGWDGTYKGAKPVPDVYVYQIEIFCDNSQVVKFEGNVALIQ